MDAIRFEPGISTDLLVDRRPGGAGGGDMFADMLGEQLKKRSEGERLETAIPRRQPVARRSDAESPAAQGRPVRAVIKHPHTLRGEAKPAGDGQKAIEVRKQDDEAAATCAEDTPIIIADGPGQDSEDQAPQPKQAEPAEPAAPAAADGPTLQVAVVQIPASGDLTASADGQAATPAPDRPAATDDATPAQPATAETVGDTVPDMAGFAAALAASQAETAATIGTNEENAPQIADAQASSDATLAALAGTPIPAKPVAEAGTEPAAETDELAIKLTPEVPRATETAKPRPSSRPAPAAEIRPQQTAPVQAPQAAATIQPAAQSTGSVGAESTAAAVDTANDGEGATVPGWALHLAQGAAAKRPDFIAQLRQHLQDLPAHEQVAVNIQRAIREGTGRLSIQLSPAELGQIHVKLEIDEEKRVTAAVTVEKPSTLELLQRDVKALERALHDAGLKMDGNDLSFSLGRQDSQEFARNMRQSDSSMRGQGSAVGEADSAVPVAAQEAVDTASGLVNVEV